MSNVKGQKVIYKDNCIILSSFDNYPSRINVYKLCMYKSPLYGKQTEDFLASGYWKLCDSGKYVKRCEVSGRLLASADNIKGIISYEIKKR